MEAFKNYQMQVNKIIKNQEKRIDKLEEKLDKITDSEDLLNKNKLGTNRLKWQNRLLSGQGLIDCCLCRLGGVPVLEINDDDQIDDLVDDALQYFQERVILMVLRERLKHLKQIKLKSIKQEKLLFHLLLLLR